MIIFCTKKNYSLNQPDSHQTSKESTISPIRPKTSILYKKVSLGFLAKQKHKYLFLKGWRKEERKQKINKFGSKVPSK
jgi:hypothetical protein